MQITYTHPKSNVALTVTGTSEELAPIVLQLINDLPVTSTVKRSTKTNTTRNTPHSSSNHYKELRKQIIADFAGGMSRDDLVNKYPVSRTTINSWIRQANLSNYKVRKTNRSRKTAVRRTSTPTPNDLRQRIEAISVS